MMRSAMSMNEMMGMCGMCMPFLDNIPVCSPMQSCRRGLI